MPPTNARTSRLTQPETSKEAEKPAKPAGADMDWSGLLERLQASGASSFLFAKGNKNRYRLLHKPGEPFYTEVETDFRGRKKIKYMVLAVDMQAEDDDRTPKGLILAKTPFKAIVALLSEGYDLWDPSGGYGITILKSGSGLETSYSVMPSPKPIPLPEDILEDAPDFETLQEEYRKMSERRAANGADDDEEALASSSEEW